MIWETSNLDADEVSFGCLLRCGGVDAALGEGVVERVAVQSTYQLYTSKLHSLLSLIKTASTRQP